ncbi:hypothetical protein QEJ31_03095 [Pigmentibacter sp. JX0631]|uniref:hypothetical protein n=1 Tax=Pigmentibacter sp. JX0631 TaxID=2976982 RepID=UPI00246979AD|nr:hypothetical protein [Pigmentibacter sp. JX0631]WGL60587.1 hypothetical protein QEJ31_03095 [Pigmentibacter sp. JX0631]
MKNILNKFVIYCTLQSVSLISCGTKTNSLINKKTSSNHVSISQIDTSTPKDMGGYHVMKHIFKEGCLENYKLEIPTNSERSFVNLRDNLNYSEIRKILDTSLKDSSIPTERYTVTPESRFLDDAKTTRLSRTVTYSSNVILGRVNLMHNDSAAFTLNKTALSYFDKNGKLNNIYDFMKTCGDEVVTSKLYSSKLIITVKIKFDNRTARNEFENKIGVVQNAVIDSTSGNDGDKKEGDKEVKGKFKLSANLKMVSDETLRHSTLSVHGIQIGGTPEALNTALKTNTCTLNNIIECQEIFDSVNKYVSEAYPKQLADHSLSHWVVEQVKTEPYDSLNIVDSNGKKLDFTITENYEDKNKLIEFRQKIRDLIIKQYDNNSVANRMLEHQELEIDLKNILKNIVKHSNNNIEFYHNFADECYRNISTCLNNKTSSIDNYIVRYDESKLERNMGKKIMEVLAHNSPLPNEKHRSSDFFTLQEIFETSDYNSIYFRIKSSDNLMIKNENSHFKLMCEKANLGVLSSKFYNIYEPFSYGFWNGIVLDDKSNHSEVNLRRLEESYNSVCEYERLPNFFKNISRIPKVFIAYPANFIEEKFIIELWGKN